MNIAVTAKGPGLGAWLDPDFGTCGHVMVVDDRDRFRSWPNAFGATEVVDDIGLAQRLVEEHVDALVTGTLSLEAYAVLKAAGVAVYLSKVDAILTLVEKVREGALAPVTGDDLASR